MYRYKVYVGNKKIGGVLASNGKNAESKARKKYNLKGKKIMLISSSGEKDTGWKRVRKC